MQEQKLLSLDDHIGKYIVPQNRFIDTSITIRQLMNHSSGIKDFTTPLFLNIYMFQPRLVLSEREVLNAIDTVEFPKGTKHSYSNSNYFILGLIVEKIMDKPLSEVFQQMVITPCQLSHTYPHLAKDIPMLAHPMQSGQDLSTRFSFLTICRQAAGAGQIASTTADLCDLFRALFIKKTLLSQSSLDQMLTFYQGDENELYGLGMFKRTYNGKELYYHTGRIVSYGCYVYCNPETNTVMALLTNNMNDIYSSRIRYKVFDAYLK
jgi:D-alanyl-D-alanine carboxypeptidase